MKEQMINYLQEMMNQYKKLVKYFGEDDEACKDFLMQMIGAKEMAEAFIHEPVNLQLDGKVTVGF